MWEPKLPLALNSARGNFGSHMLGVTQLQVKSSETLHDETQSKQPIALVTNRYGTEFRPGRQHSKLRAQNCTNHPPPNPKPYWGI